MIRMTILNLEIQLLNAMVESLFNNLIDLEYQIKSVIVESLWLIIKGYYYKNIGIVWKE